MTYEAKQIESRWYQTWQDAGHFVPKGSGQSFCLMLPPPNVTGSLHMGHAMEAALMDCLIRYHRMLGDNTHWQVGTDHAGIATQMVVERQLEREGKSRHDLGREQFTEAVWQWKEQSGNTIENQFKRMGVSADWNQKRFTMDEGLSKAVQKVFIDLYDEGLIYRGQRLVNWDTQLKTAVSDLEVEHVDTDTSLWHIRYTLVNDASQHIIVATTRPETLLGDVAVAVNPHDERYKHLIGTMLKLPLTERTIPIIADDYVESDFGTGCVKITPAHDFNDYEMGKRHDLPMISIMDIHGNLNHHAPKAYQGMERFKARKQIVKDLEALDLIEKIEPYKTKRPMGDRSNTVLEPMLTDQWYVKVAPLAEVAIAAVEKGEVQFVPDQWKNTYYAWMRDIKDWCISRQLWWGHRVPAWYDKDGKVYVAENEAAVREKYNLSDDITLTQDDDVLDTWFSSALWPFSTLGWPEETENFKQFYPTSVLICGFDIIFFWVARMIMMGYKFTGKPPFKQVYIHGLLCDHEGQKMSKSKGNVIDPIDLIDGIDCESLVTKRTAMLMQPQMKERIEKDTRKNYPEGIPAFGTDALRMTFCSLPSTQRHINFDISRVAVYRNFCNKLWNAARFIFMNLEIASRAAYTRHDALPSQFILSRLQTTIQSVRDHMAQFRFDLATQALYEFVWHDFCDWYLECAKSLLKSDDASERASVCYTLTHVLDHILRMLHPIIPFITEEIWHHPQLVIARSEATKQSQKDCHGPAGLAMTQGNTSIMVSHYPTVNADLINPDAEQAMQWVQQFVTGVRNIRGENNISPKQSLEVLIKHGECPRATQALIQTLANVSSIEHIDNHATIPFSSSFVIGEMQAFVPLEGLIDPQAEIDRLTKQVDKLDKEREKLASKLSNEGYVARAPKDIVERDQARVDELNTMIEKLKGQREGLLKA